MARLGTIATGNWTSSSTWGLVDPTLYDNSENNNITLPTSYGSTARSTAQTTGAIVVSHIGVKLGTRSNGATGQLKVHIAKNSDHSEVSGTECIINVADLPVALNTDLNGGWHFLKLATPVTLLTATAYEVEAKTASLSGTCTLFGSSSTAICCALITTTTQAPAAGDDVFINGEYTGAGTSNAFVVTMNATASSITDYGAASTSTVTPSMAVCNLGSLKFGTSASTNYYLRQSGNIVVYSGGVFSMGDSTTQIPRTSTAVLNFDCGASVDFGLTVRNLGTWNSRGLSRTSGKDIYWCKLNADSPANDLVLDVDTDTGWLDNDEIAVASTTRTPGQCEKGTINVTVTSTQITVDGFAGTSGGLKYAHSGTSPTQAEVILLTRNVQLYGFDATKPAYINIGATATVDCKWTELKWLGSGTAGKRGIETACTTGTQVFQYCSRHTSTVTGSIAWNMTGASGTGLSIINNVTFNVSDNAYVNVANSGSSIVTDNIFMYSTANAQMVVLGDVGGTFSRNYMIGCSSNAAFYLNENGATIGTMDANVIHSGGSTGFNFASNITMLGTISNTIVWRQSGNGMLMSCNEIVLDTLTMFGNSTNIAFNGSGGIFRGYNWTLSGDSSFGTGAGINFSQGAHMTLYLYNSDFGVATGIKVAHTNDITLNSLCNPNVYLINTNLASSTEVSGQSNMLPSSFISSQKHDKTSGLNKTWKKYGTLTIETTTVHTGSQSLKMTPNNASSKLESNSFFVAVASGASVTPTVYIYKDASYNGNQPRLVLKRNDAIGISADTVIATYASSTGSWNAISSATATASEDGVMEFVIDCDGTAGNVFVDTFSVA